VELSFSIPSHNFTSNHVFNPEGFSTDQMVENGIYGIRVLVKGRPIGSFVIQTFN
jgi:hypothetical protein